MAGLMLATLWAASAVAEENASNIFGNIAPKNFVEPTSSQKKTEYQLLAQEEARLAGIPFALVDAVIKIESDYEARRIGAVGEIGLMQVRPATAAMLGFRGTAADLAKPAVNIHFGATYLGQAWHLTNGDVCRTLMKYRAGHGEEVMSPLSDLYCSRARAHLLATGSLLATTITAPLLVGALPTAQGSSSFKNIAGGGARPRHGPAFWAAEEMRVRAITARVHAKWRRT